MTTEPEVLLARLLALDHLDRAETDQVNTGAYTAAAVELRERSPN
ncbi:hypothetical protein [Urbifossiella limnaea]|nr:hypothetical protein [Urbifossiella limnaea]